MGSQDVKEFKAVSWFIFWTLRPILREDISDDTVREVAEKITPMIIDMIKDSGNRELVLKSFYGALKSAGIRAKEYANL
jgi:predicted secreted protein